MQRKQLLQLVLLHLLVKKTSFSQHNSNGASWNNSTSLANSICQKDAVTQQLLNACLIPIPIPVPVPSCCSCSCCCSFSCWLCSFYFFRCQCDDSRSASTASKPNPTRASHSFSSNITFLPMANLSCPYSCNEQYSHCLRAIFLVVSLNVALINSQKVFDLVSLFAYQLNQSLLLHASFYDFPNCFSFCILYIVIITWFAFHIIRTYQPVLWTASLQLVLLEALTRVVSICTQSCLHFVLPYTASFLFFNFLSTTLWKFFPAALSALQLTFLLLFGFLTSFLHSLHTLWQSTVMKYRSLHVNS